MIPYSAHFSAQFSQIPCRTAQAPYNKRGDPECESGAYWKEMLLICTFPGVKCHAGIPFSERIERGGKWGSYQETSPSWVRSISRCLGLTLVCTHLLDPRNVFTVFKGKHTARSRYGHPQHILLYFTSFSRCSRLHFNSQGTRGLVSPSGREYTSMSL